MAVSKPQPHVYLAAAAHLGVAPDRCLVIEDSAVGTTVRGYCPEGHGRAFEGLPVQRVFAHMGQLPGLLMP